jgi:predicted short-subunit dehydrogenase-like oxidoreductase (DUF2520 family)
MMDDDFLKTTVFYGIVVRGDNHAIEQLKHAVAGIDGITVVYQRVSGEKLYIREER